MESPSANSRKLRSRTSMARLDRLVAASKISPVLERSNSHGRLAAQRQFERSVGDARRMHTMFRASEALQQKIDDELGSTLDDVDAVDESQSINPSVADAEVAAKLRHRQLMGVLQKVSVFAGLTPVQHANIIDELTEVTFKDGEYIIRQGDVGDAFFIVLRGEVGIRITDRDDGHEEEIAHRSEMDFFGEFALLTDQPRNAHAVASGEVTCLILHRDKFLSLDPLKDILMKRKQVKENPNLLDCSMIANLTPLQRAKMVDIMTPVTFKAGQYVCREGEVENLFYVVLDGEISLEKSTGSGSGGDAGTCDGVESPERPETPQSPLHPQDPHRDEARMVGKDDFFGSEALVVSAEEKGAGYMLSSDSAAASLERAPRWPLDARCTRNAECQ